MYALFRHNKQISKAHKHRICAIIEAYEQGVIMTKIGLLTGDGYTIEEVKE